ncbi:hypothetical protein KDW61_21125 [Burkholderia cenocepacia]|uniref:hypothetical protein n=1 Tax=Burkholderia cenocepacia TaxID=95486 RepID=UPI001B8FB2D8|nr:hypothetical protein [Burkholderia cenocepacia]MBR8211168.1 hypothetical protein [Burkholderia cenocepacia]
MRKVASYSLTANISGNAISGGFASVKDTVGRWLASKGTVSSSDGSGTVKYHDGREAEFVVEEIASGVGSLIEYQLTEPSETGLFQTVIRVAQTASLLAVYAELLVGSTMNRLGPLAFDARCPAVIREIIALDLDWHVGEMPVGTRPISFLGAEQAQSLIDIIWHPARTLPIVVASEQEGALLTPQLVDNIAADLSGLAVVARIDAGAAWQLTVTKGREWSCYNGAVRLYWPMVGRSSDHTMNPLWTRSALVRGLYEPRDASYRLRRLLRKKVLGSSAFSMREIDCFNDIRHQHRREQYSLRKESAKTESDWKDLADLYAEDNLRLSGELQSANRQIQQLEEQVANLELALNWRDGEPDEIDAAVEIPPATVEDAVQQARERCGELLVFGDDVGEGINTLAPDAGPPEKILQYLEALADMAKALRSGALGTTAIQWLKDRGINCSGESETVKNNKAAMKLRNWHDGEGHRQFESHMKPSDGTSPDRCARIYFDAEADAGKVVVGWIGRHPQK